MHTFLWFTALLLFIVQYSEAKVYKDKTISNHESENPQLISRSKRQELMCRCAYKQHHGTVYIWKSDCDCSCTRCCDKGCNADNPEPDCFPGDGRVQLDNDRFIPVKDIRVGHRVLTVENGRRVFSEVKTFLERQPYKNRTYVLLTTAEGNQVTMSGNHLLFVSSNNKSADMEARPASSVKRGDYIFSTTFCPEGLCPQRVVEMSLSIKQGLYVPVTDAGTLIVDGIFASCYAFVKQDIAHLSTFLYRTFPWILEPWQKDGFSPLLSNLLSLTQMFLPESLLTRA